MIKLDNLSFGYFKWAEALTNVSACIGSGIHLLLGENGAGKTTLLHIIAGLLRPGSGECLYDGTNVAERIPSVMSRIFFLGESMNFPDDTINKMAKIHAPFYPAFDSEMLRENLSQFGFTGNESLRSLSLGNRKKAQLAYALSLRADVLLLDEPTNGLDITARQTLQSMIIRCVGETQTVIISTHTVSELQGLYDGIIMLSKGRLILSMPTYEIISKLTFKTSPMPPVRFLFKELRMGLNHYICARGESEEETALNYTLLYNALLSPQRDIIIQQLTKETPSWTAQ
ncbi:MAG: ABC transporter ATP-binding protein [Muribaculum sp.]|nr:ABC transporter ATP-binding protein [Muribaculum sp.]